MVRQTRYEHRDKMRKWREKRGAEGGRNLSVWLEPETLRMVDELLDRYPRLNKKKLVAEAVRVLYNSNFETDS